MLKQMYCPECGGEIHLTYERTPTTFNISNGKLKKVNYVRPDNELIFHCENDIGHNIKPKHKSKQYILFRMWCESVEEHFYNNSLWEI
jgi:hypothetical protein